MRCFALLRLCLADGLWGLSASRGWNNCLSRLLRYLIVPPTASAPLLLPLLPLLLSLLPWLALQGGAVPSVH